MIDDERLFLGLNEVDWDILIAVFNDPTRSKLIAIPLLCPRLVYAV
jgi:hypothetical protein